MIAVDPGKNGAIVVDSATTGTVAYPMPETCRDVVDFFKERTWMLPDTVYMEEVGGYVGRPQPGSAMFKFGRGFGNLEASIMAAGFRLELVRPQKWQKELGLGTSAGMDKHEWKNKLKATAQRLYPEVSVTLQNADALLILEYARRKT